MLVDPAMGELAPHSRTPISLAFHAKEARQCVFNVKCHIESSPPHKFLNLNVKGEGCSVETALFYEDVNNNNVSSGGGQQRVELSHSSLNEIHMGEVEKNETCFRNLHVTNGGKHGVKFEWLLSSETREALECFAIEPAQYFLEPGDQKHCVLK